MKSIVNILRIVVGLLFIFSGFIKAIDPMGLSYKMQEYFELWGLMSLNQHTLWMSVLMIAFEIIAGVALIIGWKMKLFSWLLLLMILFFTFLTGYAVISGKFRDCGCFGDCIPITPMTSFLKDVFLTVFILILFFNRDRIQAWLSPRASNIVMLLAVVFSFGIQYYALNYLPPIDCLPFKKGSNISEKMKIPPGAVSDSFAIRFIYKKDGKNFEFSPAELPADLDTYTYVDRIDKLVRAGNAIPKLQGFALVGASGEDSTEVILNEPYAIMIVSESFSKNQDDWKTGMNELITKAKNKNIPVFIITNQKESATRIFQQLPILVCDYTAIRSAARVDPTVMLLQKGTVIEKSGYRQLDIINAAIEKLPALAIKPVVTDSLAE